MKITKANGKIEYTVIENLKKRSSETDEKIVNIVSSIIKGVKEDGDNAVREYTVRFDGGVPHKSVIEKEELEEYLEKVDEDFRTALINAKNNIYDFHKKQIQQSWLTTEDNGVIMGQRIRGLHRVGIYVPGGTAAYPSSVLM
ncbi:MAG: histidinol dehydrogenase, partial [Eubacterium sp.]|nr:histidinol dehydrogenase [Eubacterium sp.]